MLFSIPGLTRICPFPAASVVVVTGLMLFSGRALSAPASPGESVLSAPTETNQINRKQKLMNSKHLLDQPNLLRDAGKWIAESGGPVWRITFRGPDGKDRELASTDAGAPDGFSWTVKLGESTAVVALSVRADGPLSYWSLKVELPDGWVVRRAEGPILSGLAYRPNLKYGATVGWGVQYDVKPGMDITGVYPSCRAVMPFMVFYEGGEGLYIGAHDAEAHHKDLNVKGEEGNWCTSITHWPAIPDKTGGVYELPYEVAIGTYKGDYYDGAQLYRPFALTTPWTKAGPLSKRPTPKWLLDADLWLKPGETLWTDDEEASRKSMMQCVDWCRKAKEFFQVPIALHWYRWHVIPYDTLYPEYFPAKPGFKEGVRAVQEMGLPVMPYINGRLCDPESATWKEKGGSEWAARQENGEPYTEVYGSKVPLNVMCPSAPQWQDTIANLVGRLTDEIGVNGVYIDQIAAAKGELCFNRNHPHLPGGGNFWWKSYRELLTKCRSKLKKDGMLTSEENAECWMDLLDGLLIVNTPTNEGPTIPLFPAVYAGWSVPFGFQYMPGSEKGGPAFRTKMGRCFLYGSQLGWVDASRVMSIETEEDREFVRAVAKCRSRAHLWLLFGRFLGMRTPEGDYPRITGEGAGSFGGTYRIDLPSVMASEWESEDGTRAIAVANMDDSAHTVRLKAPSAKGKVRIIGPEGTPEERTYEDGVVSVELPRRDARMVVFI